MVDAILAVGYTVIGVLVGYVAGRRDGKRKALDSLRGRR
jgi:hypothetical protein